MADLSHQLHIQPRFGARSRALVVDSHATARTMLVSQLRALGVGQVLSCTTAHEARQHFDNMGFDVLLCEHKLDHGTPGQHLIDALRREGLLSLRTVVVMLSGQSTYRVVAEVAESALDGFIIKPYTTAKLEDRLIAAFMRKEALKAIFDALEAELHPEALQLCETRYLARGPYWTNAARIGAELAIRLERLPLARAMYAAVLADKAVPWAKLGLARVLEAAGQQDEAISTIQNLLAEEPKFADAYDVMGRIHAELGNFDGAVEAYRQAVEITPFSVQRTQKYAILAWYAATPEVALKALAHAADIGSEAPGFDHQTLLLLAMAHQRRGDAAGLRQCRQRLASAVAQQPAGAAGGAASQRLRRLGQMVLALEAVQAQDRPALQQCLVTLADQLLAPDFDVEAATNLLQLLATSDGAGLRQAQADVWVRTAGLRFCVSKQVTEVLARACVIAPTLIGLVRAAQAEINEISRSALSEGLAGDHQAAVQQLLQAAERTHNAKLLELAGATLGRHQAHIAEAAALAERCDALKSLCSGVGHGHLLSHEARDAPAEGTPGRRRTGEPA